MHIIMPSRRGFLAGMLVAAAGPMLVRASSLMPSKQILPPIDWLIDTPFNFPDARVVLANDTLTLEAAGMTANYIVSRTSIISRQFTLRELMRGPYPVVRMPHDR